MVLNEKTGKYEVTYQELQDFRKDVIKNTIELIKEDLRKNIYDGVECPCCKSFNKADKVMLSESMVNSLLSLYRITGNDTLMKVHKDKVYKHWKRKSNVIGKLKHWGLVLQIGNGEYCITDEGIKFINGALAVPECQFIFRDSKIKPNEEVNNVTINQIMS